MDSRQTVISVIMPALNEEKNILSAIDDALSAFKKFGITGEIIVINDGSRDNTALIIKNKIDEVPDKIRMINHNVPKGIGASFWDGVDVANGDAVIMLPGDNENDPCEILRYLKLLEDVDMVIPFTFNKGARSLSRNIISFIYRFIINTTFFTSFNYTNGTIIYRKALLEELDYKCSGFFFQTDILIRLVKRGYLFAEVPYRIRRREEGESKAISLCSLRGVLEGYFKLFRDIYFGGTKKQRIFNSNSAFVKRYKAISE